MRLVPVSPTINRSYPCAEIAIKFYLDEEADLARNTYRLGNAVSKMICVMLETGAVIPER